MSDKQQLKEINEEIQHHIKRVMGENQPPAVCRVNLTEQQAKALAERMPQAGVVQVLDDEPLCMAKRIEELEAQVRVMAGLLREARPYMDHRGGAGVKGYTLLAKEIDTALSGNLPARATPKGWQLVPVELTDEMVIAAVSKDPGLFRHQAEDLWSALLAAAPNPEVE